MPSFAAEPNAQARTVVQWFRDCGCRNRDIVTRTGLTNDFVYRWTKREDTDIVPGRGPAPIISDHQADALVKAVLKLRFHSADALRADIVNPDTGKMVCRQTVCDALERGGAISKRVQKGQQLPKHISHHKKGEWPASSPDLNPIERLWAILQDRVVSQRAYTYDKLLTVVTDTWWELEQNTIRKLYDSMGARVKNCIKAEGGRFKV